MSDAVNLCERATWYSFRWVSKSKPVEGQRQSTFDTGNYWETRLLNDLEMIGCEVQRVDIRTGKQFLARLADGHLRGKLDGKVISGVPESPNKIHIVECKSHNLKSYKELIKSGVSTAKIDHYAQTQLYMHSEGIDRALYLAVCKDDDARYAERVRYDMAYCLRVEARVQYIVYSENPPMKLHEDPSHKMAFQCGWCAHKATCHEDKIARVNCRTCLHSTPLPGAKWRCDKFKMELDYKYQQAGCRSHRYIPALVYGVQYDIVGDDIHYKMNDGSIWIDGDKGK